MNKKNLTMNKPIRILCQVHWEIFYYLNGPVRL